MAVALDVVVSTTQFWFAKPPGLALIADGKQLSAVDKLTGQSFPLSQQLQELIAADMKHKETSSGWFYWLCYGCAGSGFDFDKDMAVLRREVLQAVAASSLLRNDIDFQLQEHVREGSWRQGRALLQLVLLGARQADPRTDAAAPYQLAHQLAGTA